MFEIAPFRKKIKHVVKNCASYAIFNLVLIVENITNFVIFRKFVKTFDLHLGVERVFSVFVKENNIDIDIFSVDGIENSSSVSYELDKPYSSMRNGVEETTVCSRLNENLLIYNSKVPANGWNIGNDNTVWKSNNFSAI